MEVIPTPSTSELYLVPKGLNTRSGMAYNQGWQQFGRLSVDRRFNRQVIVG